MSHAPAQTLPQRVSRQLLPFVSQPAQYIGGEINQLVGDGDWQRAELRLAIAFPDAYALGMSQLGCQIIYWLCNHLPGVCAERVYCPRLDAEQIMRHKKIELFTWDTRRPVAEADILAFSLQYELTYTNLLTMLDLAGIPLHADQRTDSHPIVLAGGPGADNPEPLAQFIDLLVIGDAEPSLPPLLQAFKQLKNARLPRSRIILELAKRFNWLYAPALYEVTYNADRTIKAVRPKHPDIPPTIHRCRTRDLDNAPFPVRPLISHIQTVHDRINIEIMRGCPHRCRFCHAGYTKRPVTYRSPEKILDLAEQAWLATGHDEIGLLSLSTGDYPHLTHLAGRINERFAPRHVNISVPSLRADRIAQDLPWMLSSVRKPGLTFAPEVGTDRARSAIRKNITNQGLFDALRAAYQAGWRTVKLYFVCGIPHQTPQDIAEILHLAESVSRLRRELLGSPAAVNVTVSWLIPKPHTPLQWAAQPSADYCNRTRQTLARLARGRRLPIRLKFHNVQRSVLEGALARGDRRLGAVIETAWGMGARFDAWDESFNPQIWQRAFEQNSLKPDWYAHRSRSYEEILPWQHLRAGPPSQYLRRQYDDLLVKAAPPQTSHTPAQDPPPPA